MKETWSEALRYNYPLTPNSLVMDVGGFEGDWVMGIYTRYACNVLVFEPVKEFYEIIASKFHSNSKVLVYNYGLDGMSTSVLSKGGERVEIKDIFTVLNNFAKVDLIKLNIEGAEYDLLDYIIENGLQTKLINIQIQFHSNVADYEKRRESIREALAKTHHLTYDYPVGLHENWELNW